MLLSALFLCLLALASLGAAQTTTTTATTTTPSSANGGSQFVRSQNGQFFLGDEPFQYIGTSAYWLQLIDNDDDMNKTLSEIASRGIRVVKTWAFNDVTEIPEEGVWIRVFHSNGTIEINTGPNGILRLDRIVRVAKSVGIHILFSLTNNWFPNVADAGGVARRDLNGNALPRNYLSNDFGGMDTYVKHFFPNITVDDLAHDQFYTNTQILNAYKEYAALIVGRYKEETSVLGWEAANDPRCNSTLPARSICQPQTITQWTSESAEHIKENDPNHLVATGDSGYYCVDCVKLFPVTPPPQTSPLPGKRRRWTGPLTRAKLIAKDDAWKKRNLPDTQTLHRKSGGIGIRGKWFAPKDAGMRKRQSNSFGPLYDGTFGVDTEDLLNAPGVDFSSFQYFPDQNSYAPLTTSSVSNFSELVQSGIDWIEQHAETANTYGKPATLNGFGLVTSQNSNTYAPFNSSVVQQSGVGTTSEQQVSAYEAWINAAINANVQGIIHYQWGQTGLTQTSSPALSNQSGVGQTNSTISTYSPNDGYAAYDDGVKGALQAGAVRIANNAARKR